ncbi:adenylate kinase [Spiroplasma endosymbiont of Aspidapion aeneum]|uniref:adenylate kinase n=1 Tax=Spiroplasma endosymbiont of Aspidapion aeneum TaxID=3066276 RepID=UPI00313CAFBC
MNLLLLGLPGSGKGTFSEHLEKEKKMLHMSTGDLFRKNIDNKTKLGLDAKKYLESGKYVPDHITIDMVKDYIKKNNYFDNLIYDGFPRTVFQAQALDDFLIENNSKLDKVIYIDIQEEIVVNRLKNRLVCSKCQSIYNKKTKAPLKEGVCDFDGEKLLTRKDDLPENIAIRLQVYKEQTSPLLDYYNERIFNVNIGDHNIEEFIKTVYDGLKI